MTGRKDRVHQLDISQENQSAAGPHRRSRAPAGPDRSDPAAPWSVIDGWVRDGKIRRDALIALALVLIAVVGIVAAVTGALGPLIGGLAGSPVARVVAGGVSVAGLAGYGGVRLHRRRARRGGRAHPRRAGQPARQRQ
ncbi:hypothetical protein [Amycolatopsis silviterrae]|uniref:DUF3040 domain-containing protein n=1 Tax=Amycolatopsis silviterrae TaxID=1656914 RepID=A0ABW5HD39_9PSEU